MSLILDVLRPSTFGQLTSVLLEAEAVGEPYHVLHFDGRAVVADIERDGIPEELPKARATAVHADAARPARLFDFRLPNARAKRAACRWLVARRVAGRVSRASAGVERLPGLEDERGGHDRRREHSQELGISRSSHWPTMFSAQGVNAVAEIPYHLGPVARRTGCGRFILRWRKARPSRRQQPRA